MLKFENVLCQTVAAALAAPLPKHCRRTVYLCDDGKDGDKKRFVEGLKRADIVYVTRERPKGVKEMNGKSANVNNLARMLYPETESIPPTEVIALFDADQV